MMQAWEINMERGRDAERERATHHGMTLRDYFAGQALASIPIRNWTHIGDDSAIIEAWAKCAYATADAMLQQRDKQ